MKLNLDNNQIKLLHKTCKKNNIILPYSDFDYELSECWACDVEDLSPTYSYNLTEILHIIPKYIEYSHEETGELIRLHLHISFDKNSSSCKFGDSDWFTNSEFIDSLFHLLLWIIEYDYCRPIQNSISIIP